MGLKGDKDDDDAMDVDGDETDLETDDDMDVDTNDSSSEEGTDIRRLSPAPRPLVQPGGVKNMPPAAAGNSKQPPVPISRQASAEIPIKAPLRVATGKAVQPKSMDQLPAVKSGVSMPERQKSVDQLPVTSKIGSAGTKNPSPLLGNVLIGRPSGKAQPVVANKAKLPGIAEEQRQAVKANANNDVILLNDDSIDNGVLEMLDQVDQKTTKVRRVLGCATHLI